MLVARALKNSQLIRRLPISINLRLFGVGSLPQRGRRTQPGVLTPGKVSPRDRPERALDARVGYRVYCAPRNASSQDDIRKFEEEFRTLLQKHGTLSMSNRRGTDPAEPCALSGRALDWMFPGVKTRSKPWAESFLLPLRGREPTPKTLS